MCGLCGIVRFDGSDVDPKVVTDMMDRIAHRGPDDSGLFVDGNVGLGFRRLSIIDLSSAGHQPMMGPGEREVLTFNGEIFNYVELRSALEGEGVGFQTRTDTEVLLQALRHWGEDALDRLNGMWAFALFDRETRTLTLSRDRYGIKPLYLYEGDGFLAFASELPALLTVPGVRAVANRQAVYDYLVYNRTDHDAHTFFEGIRRIDHGHVATVDTQGDGRVVERRWYDLRQRVAAADPIRHPDDFRELLVSAVRLRLRSDVPVGVCLSGGLDSSAITSVITGALGFEELNTFSAVYGAGEFGDESPFIDEHQSIVKNMHRIVPDGSTLREDLSAFVEALGEPVPSTSPYAQFKVMELAARNVVVTVDGQGADELLAGYHYFFGYQLKEFLTSGRLLRLLRESRAYMSEHRSTFALKALVYLMLPTSVRDRVSVRRRGYLAADFADAHRGRSHLPGGLYGSASLQDALIDHFEYKLEHLLKWEDRNSMWHSLEARVPFLDYRVVEQVLATPSDDIIRDGQTKWLLREGMKGHMPERVRTRSDKVGFGTPQDRWFREPVWRTYIEELLNSPSFRERGIVDAEAAQRLYGDHCDGRISIAREIWKWIHLELWFRRFIDSS